MNDERWFLFWSVCLGVGAGFLYVAVRDHENVLSLVLFGFATVWAAVNVAAFLPRPLR